jgi:hypothetical protein
MMSVSSQKSLPCNTEFIRGIGKNRLEPGEEFMDDAAVLSLCSLLRNSLPKRAGVLEHSRDEQTKFFSPFFWALPSDCI